MQGTLDPISVRLALLTPQGEPLGGIVDVRLTPASAPGDPIQVAGHDASNPIVVRVLPGEAYQLTITPIDTGQPITQTLQIPAGGTTAMRVVIDRHLPDVAPPVTRTLQGALTFDHGLPAAGVTVRLYTVGFGGRDERVGEVTSNADGRYSFSFRIPVSTAGNIQVRAVDAAGKEIAISATKFGAGVSGTLNLVVPASVRPLAPEYQRLAADMQRAIGGVASLAQAAEDNGRQDLTLLSQTTKWDARVLALGAIAAQHTAVTGLPQDVLYALYRCGLPTDTNLLATVPVTSVRAALEKAADSGIVSLTTDQVAATATAFQNFATRTLLASKAPGAASSFNDLIATHVTNEAQRTAFANAYFNASSGAQLWAEAAKLGLPAQTIDALKAQGKLLYLTFNNGALSRAVQQAIGAPDALARLVERDYHKPAAWEQTLKQVAGSTGGDGLERLIPSAYSGKTVDDRLTAYAGDLARRVARSFPTETVARMVETRDVAVHPAVAGTVTNVLRSASKLGYSLGRTPLNAFLTRSAAQLPAMDEPARQTVKTLHRMYQVTPSTESLQVAMELGFRSAHEIASYSKSDFLNKFGARFPAGEAAIVYGQSQTVSSVTFNIYAMAKALDTAPPVYALSSSNGAKQDAKAALVKSFPSMESLFGSLDYCQCEECRSVTSPAAYFVDLLDMLGKESAPNAAGNTPLDVLIGKQNGITGRRPDLGALPLTCANTNTAMPYIDIVNEILEYYVAHSNSLDGGVAYDTGTATTADLTAEPQHVIASVYNTTLKQARYPLDLPFDLWIETVRGFLDYFKTPLAQVLDRLAPDDPLELFTGTSYTRAEVLAESLGMSPAEYGVFTATNSAAWFALYGSYATEAAALAELKNAKTLSRRLGVSYQGLVDLVKTGFINPGLWPLIYQFERFGIDIGTAFSYTNQPGYPALTAQQKTDFESSLDALTATYKQANPSSTFNAKTWLTTTLPANYSKKVLVLADPNTGCNFSGTTLQYADGSPATPLDFLKLNLLVRLCNRLGCVLNDDEPHAAKVNSPWLLDEIDRALQTFFPVGNLPAWTNAGFSAAFGNSWKTALVYIAHLDDLNRRLAPALGRVALLPLWGSLPTQGENPLYARIFLTPSSSTTDFAFDDPAGAFPTPTADLAASQQTLDAHSTVVQGALGLSADELAAILTDAGVTTPAVFSLANLSICYRYSLLAQCLQISVTDLIALKALSGLNPFQPITTNPLTALADDVLLKQTLTFVEQAGVVRGSGFTVEDLEYLLRHRYDPAGKYQSDPNALMTLVQAVATGLRQIDAQHTVPADPAAMPEATIDQTLSGLIPASILKRLFGHLANTQTYSASATSATPLNAADFAQAPELTLSYDAVTTTQTLSCTGLLLDWRKTELQALNTNAALNGLVGTLLAGVQEQARTALAASIADVLGVWASLVQYEAVATGVSPAQAISDPLNSLVQADPSLSFTYDPADQIQWLGHRGVLTASKLTQLTAINGSPTLATLLAGVQQQALPSYNDVAGRLVATWCGGATYKASQNGVASATAVDATAFAAALAAAQANGTIAGPVPAVHITYDATTQVQTLTVTGVLTAAMRTQLASLVTAPPATATLLSNLLQQVRAQAVAEFQFLASGLLAPALNDPDPFVGPPKAELIKVFVPLLARKLSRQFVLQTIAAALGADRALVEVLATDAALLTNPSRPGTSLLQAFTEAGRSGLTASYFDAASALIAGGVATTADTSDPTNSVAGAVRCRFEGYIQVPTDGPYRFFARLGAAGTQVTFVLDSPSPTALPPSPVIQATAANANDEPSQFVQLKAGVAYHASIEFSGLGSGGASVSVQGENLPKGPLSQIVLYPEQTVDAFSRARTLLAKVLQILQVTALNQRELTYIVTHASDFGGLRLSALPTEAGDDTPAKATALFAEFLALADYADLRKGPAGATDGLIDVFRSATTPAGLSATYYASVDETGTPSASGFAVTADTTDPSNSAPGTRSGRFEGFLVVPADGSYDFFAELGKAGAQATLRLDAPRGTIPLVTPIVLQHTAAADGEEAHQAVTLAGNVPYHVTVDFASLGTGNASLLVQGPSLPKGSLAQLSLYPVSQLPPWTVLANLTRRDPQVVRDVASALGSTALFTNSAGARRLWNALQLVQTLGLPVQAIRDSVAIATPAPASPDLIASTFKNAVKAQYTPDQWRPIAQSVFDPLRQKKRNALVSHLVNTLALDSANQLFEYFLVDPGMEPVVQTSRLRLALSSVQTFVQRCLLNLESGNANAALDVAASAVPADWWAWMKRYRIWDVNRKIFLFPENWMEPEYRLDKTDLFRALEGAVLQDDMTQDLAEDAFAEYLKGLDLRARLDIVASYLDQDAVSPGETKLYVLGRTYSVPHKYFFRTYADGVWSGWEPVTADVEGDHVVLAFWRGRLNLFWVTFTSGANTHASSSGQSGAVAQLPFDTLVNSITLSHAQAYLQLQLHWSEYVKGKWTKKVSSDPKKKATVDVYDGFDLNRDVYIHVAKETDIDGNEGAVRVLLDFVGYDRYFGFRVTNKTGDPAFGKKYGQQASVEVYNAHDVDATQYGGSTMLQAAFLTHLASDGSSNVEVEQILQTVNDYELLECGNPVVPPFLPASDPAYQEAGTLVAPFFYKDGGDADPGSHKRFQDERTFFVQPSLTETVVREWDGWAVGPAKPDRVAFDPDRLKHVRVIPQVPKPIPIDPGDPAPYSVFQLQDRTDWLTEPAAAISFGKVAVGKNGALGKQAVAVNVGGK